MSSIFDSIKKLFTQQTASQPFVKGPIVRSENYLIQFKKWQEANGFFHFQALLRQHFAIAVSDALPSDVFLFVENQQMSGILMYEMPTAFTIEQQFILDFCAQQIKKLGYVRQLADVRMNDKNDYVEKIERYYFKLRPSVNDFNGSKTLAPQLFGNILLELSFKNDVFLYFKLQANYYTDSKYAKPERFHNLINFFIND